MDFQDFPDAAAARQIQNALWQVGEVSGAAVMIGAGFSRFADKVAATSPTPPLWSDFQVVMANELYPGGGAPSDPLVLAQEYSAALGDAALEDLIRELVSDKEWEPGTLHRKLLQLPWADVLTTNWDTLLERGAALDLESAYDVVVRADDLTRARRPRIVKLHGSLPSTKPFIFTAEEFRTYPTKFSAFVNTARQALLENELCLLGFSGDDPNFYQWAGWVRDQVGTSARPIRLVGVLNLTPSRRSFLMQRNITPVDLAPLVQNEADDDKHKLAANRFIDFLHSAKPDLQYEWKVEDRRSDTQDWVNADLQAIVDRWRREREVHQGWLVTPRALSQMAHHFTIRETSFANLSIGGASAAARPTLIYEIIWRHAALLETIPEDLALEVDKAILSGDVRNLPHAKRNLVIEYQANGARRRRDWVTFEGLIGMLSEDDEGRSLATYQRCLRARDELDFSFLHVNVPHISGADPIWLMRRASLEVELHQDEQALRTLRDAKARLRQLRARSRNNIWLSSRETWVDLVLGSLDASADYRPKLPGHDATDILRTLDSEIEQARASSNRVDEPEREFDAGHYRITSRPPTSLQSASLIDRAEMLADHVGLPRSFEHRDILAGRFEQIIAARNRFDDRDAWFAAKLVQNPSSAVLNRYFHRNGIASLPIEVVQTLIASLQRLISFGLGQSASADQDTADRWNLHLGGAVELLSRLATRCSPEEALLLFQTGESLLSHKTFRRWGGFRAIENLLRRSLESMDVETASSIALAAYSLPLDQQGEEGPDGGYDLPDITYDLPRSALTTQRAGPDWAARIDALLNAAASDKKQARNSAVGRLTRLVEAKFLNDEQKQAFGEALWSTTGKNGLPDKTNLLAHVFLELPHPPTVDVARAFRSAVTVKLIDNGVRWDTVQALHGASFTLDGQYSQFRLLPDEALQIAHVFLKWWENRQFKKLSNSERKISFAIACAMISVIIPSLDSTARDSSIDTMLELTKSVPEVLISLPAIVPALDARLPRVTHFVRKALATREEVWLNSALNGMYWLAREDPASPLFSSVIAEICTLCLMLHTPSVRFAMDVMTDLVKANVVPEIERLRLVDALELIITRFSYHGIENTLSPPDLGLIKASATRLASALANAGHGADPTIQIVIGFAAADPLPEVRSSQRHWKDHD